jgi:hypothetical protein
MNIGISREFRAVVALVGVQDASAQEAESGAAVHRPLQHLEPIYLALSRTGGLGEIESSLHGAEIAPQAGDKFLQRRGARILEHFVQGFLTLLA